MPKRMRIIWTTLLVGDGAGEEMEVLREPPARLLHLLAPVLLPVTSTHGRRVGVPRLPRGAQGCAACWCTSSLSSSWAPSRRMNECSCRSRVVLDSSLRAPYVPGTTRPAAC